MNNSTPHTYLILILLCALFQTNCTTDNIDPKIRNRYAKAIEHYTQPEDTLKRKALHFLLKNISGKFGTNPTICEKWVKHYKILYEESEKVDYNFKHNYLEDKGMNIYEQEKYVLDTSIVTSDDLIENIDLAFKAWNYPWARHLTFDEFCAYILPYRFEYEPFSKGWRSFFDKELSNFTDSLIQAKTTDPLQVCDALCTGLYPKTRAYLPPLPFVKIQDYYQYPIGDCSKWNVMIALAGRSIGLPIAKDFNLQFSRFPGSHPWLALTNDGHEQTISFNMNFDSTMATFTYDGVQMFREEFAWQPRIFVNHLYPLHRHKNIRNVTDKYLHHFPSVDVTIPIPDDYKKSKEEIYLCNFGIGAKIEPIYQPIIRKDSLYIENLLNNTEILYQLCTYDKKNKQLQTLGNPFSINKEGQVHHYIPGDHKDTILILRKYPETYDEEPYFKQIQGAQIQGSNDKNFRNPHTLATSDPDKKIQTYYEFTIPPHTPYRYYRFVPSGNGNLNLSELHFLVTNKKGTIQPVTTYFTENPGTDKLENLNDGKIGTNYITYTPQWIGIDLGKEKQQTLKHVGVLARNSLNNIQKGTKYELLYFDKGWHSLGEKTADNLFIIWRQVPQNAVFLLKNKEEGEQIRVFMNENGIQNFW